MTPDPDTMTPEQLRDALAKALGWTCKCAPNDPHREWASYTAIVHGEDERPTLITQNHHPIPALDSTEALGVIAGMVDLVRGSIQIDGTPGVAWRFTAAMYPAWGGRPIVAHGQTETIARARLVLKFFAAKPAFHDAV